MPKRPPTPPPPEDEPRYVVVVHPYPLNANLLLHADRRTLALWLACCTGKDVLLALYYKPSSPGMVIVEVDRYFEPFDSLLGMHSWSQFLKRPTEEDMDKSSKVFWCVYNSGRLVQKNGWKRVDIEEHWFDGWSPSNNKIKHPYPRTTRCDVPPEAKTGMPLCRPLPQETFPTPPARPPPPVGSAQWLQSRSTDVSSDVPSSSRRRKGDQPAPPATASVISSTTTTSSGSARPPPPPPPESPISAWVTNQRRQGNWSKPPPSIASISSLSPSTLSTSSVGSRTPSTWGVARPSARPPGLTSSASSISGQSIPEFRSYQHFDWSADVERHYQADQDEVQTTTPGSSVSLRPAGNTAPPRRIPAPEGAIDPVQDYEYDEEDVPKRSTADAMRDMFNSAPRASSVGNNTGLQEIEEDDYQDDYLAWAYPEAVQTTTRDRTPTGGEAGGNDNPWDGYTVSRLEPPTKINIKGGEKWICSEHGPLCNPGICQTRRALERDRQRQQERDDRLKAKEERMERGRKNAEKKERKGLDSSHEMPPHLAFRGAGGWGAGSGSGTSTSSGSGSEGEGDNPRNSGSPTGSGSRSPAPSPAPSAPPESVVGPDEWREQQGSSLWGEEDEEAPRVSLPTGTAWSGASSNRVGGGSGTTNYKNQSKNTKNNGNNISRGIAGASRQQPTSRSTAAPSGRGDATVPAGAQTSVWGRAPLARPEDPRGAASIHSVSGDAPAGAQSPAPKQLQSVWDTPSAASAVTTTSPIRNSRSTGPDSDVAPAPRSGQQNGRQRERGHSGSTGASSSTASEHRSAGGLAANTTISSPLSSAGPRSPSSASPSLTSPLGIFVPVEGGFPTYADTEWGDPIAMAVKAQPSKRKSKSTSGTPSTASPSAAGADTGDDNLESGRGQQQEATGSNAGTGRARAPRRGGRNARRRGAAAAAPARATQDVAPPREPDVTPPPGGPDEPWCNEDVEW